MKTATPKLLTRLVFGELNHSLDYVEECSKFDVHLNQQLLQYNSNFFNLFRNLLFYITITAT